MRKLFFLLICGMMVSSSIAQKCDKGCGKITKVEPINNANIRPDRALLVFKFLGPGGKPATKWVKIVVDNDTVVPTIDATGSTKITSKSGAHKLKFKAPYWYLVTMDKVVLKNQMMYNILVRFEAEEIIGGTRRKG